MKEIKRITEKPLHPVYIPKYQDDDTFKRKKQLSLKKNKMVKKGEFYYLSKT